MCDPLTLTIASIGVSAASGVIQNNASVDYYNQNQKNALAAMYAEQRQLTERQLQEQAAARLRSRQIAIKGAEDRADAEVAGAGRGMTGASISNVLADVSRKALNDLTTNQTNWEWTAQQLQREKEATLIKAQSRINSVSKPSVAGAVLGIAGDALGAGSNYLKM